jgi:hypothetical protein
MSLVYSNLPSPKIRWNFGGIRVKHLNVYLPAVGEMLCGIFAGNHGDILKICLITDKHYVEFPDELW